MGGTGHWKWASQRHIEGGVASQHELTVTGAALGHWEGLVLNVTCTAD